MIATFSPPAEVLLERYGVSAHKVFGGASLQSASSSAWGTPPPSRQYSASSVRSHPRGPGTAQPLPVGPSARLRSAGSQASISSPVEYHSLRCGGSAGGASSSTANAALEEELIEFDAEEEGGGLGALRTAGALSLSELRSIVLGIATKQPLKERSAAAQHDRPAQSVPPRRARPQCAPSPLTKGSRQSCRNQVGLSPSLVGEEGKRSHSAAVRQAAAEASRERVRSSPSRARRSLATLGRPTRALSGDAVPGSGASACSGEDPELDQMIDDDDEDPHGLAEGAEAGLGKGKKKGKHGSLNPFVAGSDREMRLSWERRWLKDDEVYMRERLKGMRVDSVQVRLEKGHLSDNVLYDDQVYFGPYSCALKTMQQKKVAAQPPRLSSIPGVMSRPQMKHSSAVSAAIKTVEAEHHAKIKKGQGPRPTHTAISLLSMSTVLQESSRIMAGRPPEVVAPAPPTKQAAAAMALGRSSTLVKMRETSPMSEDGAVVA